jgi:hypothetical protein
MLICYAPETTMENLLEGEFCGTPKGTIPQASPAIVETGEENKAVVSPSHLATPISMGSSASSCGESSSFPYVSHITPPLPHLCHISFSFSIFP